MQTPTKTQWQRFIQERRIAHHLVSAYIAATLAIAGTSCVYALLIWIVNAKALGL